MEWFADIKQKWFAIFSIDNKEFYGAGGLNDILKSIKKPKLDFIELKALSTLKTKTVEEPCSNLTLNLKER